MMTEKVKEAVNRETKMVFLGKRGERILVEEDFPDWLQACRAAIAVYEQSWKEDVGIEFIMVSQEGAYSYFNVHAHTSDAFFDRCKPPRHRWNPGDRVLGVATPGGELDSDGYHPAFREFEVKYLIQEQPFVGDGGQCVAEVSLNPVPFSSKVMGQDSLNIYELLRPFVYAFLMESNCSLDRDGVKYSHFIHPDDLEMYTIFWQLASMPIFRNMDFLQDSERKTQVKKFLEWMDSQTVEGRLADAC